VAAMPSISRMKKLSVLGVAIATLGVSATSASADDVWLWACHGPSGEGVGNAFGSNNLTDFAGGCASQATDLDSGGLRGILAVNADGEFAYGSTASANLTVPPGTSLAALRVERRLTGSVAGVTYEAKALGGSLESASGSDVAAAEKSYNFPVTDATGGAVSFSLSCGTTTGCPAGGPAQLDFGRIGMRVIDAKAPKAAVGGFRSPASGTLELDFAASDEGLGLAYAEAGIVGQPMKREYFNTACRDLTEGGNIDLPLAAVETDGPCEKVARKTVSVDTTSVADGDQKIAWRVVDLAGNVWPAAGTEPTSFSVLNNVNLGTNTQTLNIGTSGTTTPAANNNTPNAGAGGVAGTTSQNCRSPRLSFSLSNKPMRVTKGVPVLQYGKRYRFNGRLTCVINGKRKSAPKRTRVDILNKVGSKNLEKAGTTVADNGKLTVILAYRSSRTITFRFTNSDGQRSQVSIKVLVAKKKKS
jgi:hypothetical protein